MLDKQLRRRIFLAFRFIMPADEICFSHFMLISIDDALTTAAMAPIAYATIS